MGRQRGYWVTFHEVATVTEFVGARNAREAIEKVKRGDGERVEFVVDDDREPFGHRAVWNREV